jgi:hypothetical protein
VRLRQLRRPVDNDTAAAAVVIVVIVVVKLSQRIVVVVDEHVRSRRYEFCVGGGASCGDNVNSATKFVVVVVDVLERRWRIVVVVRTRRVLITNDIGVRDAHNVALFRHGIATVPPTNVGIKDRSALLDTIDGCELLAKTV